MVPPHVVDLHYEYFRAAREALVAEGFAAIHVIRPGWDGEVVRRGGDG